VAWGGAFAQREKGAAPKGAAPFHFDAAPNIQRAKF
jgi:hypothetical protein